MADNELNRKIAEAKGFEHLTMQADHYSFASGEGRVFSGQWITLIDDDELYGEVFPKDWQHDLNAAWELFVELPAGTIDYDVQNKLFVGSGMASDFRWVDIADKSPQVAAAAICEAWIGFKGRA